MDVVSESTLSHPAPDMASKSARLDDLIPLFGGGFVLAGVAIMGCALINAMAFAFYDYFFGGEDAQSWPTFAVIGAGVFAVVISVLVGRWLFNLRGWIGKKGDPAEIDMARRKQRSFTIGAMCLYLPVTPVLWVLFVAIANSAT